MHNPFLQHSRQLRQSWHDLRTSLNQYPNLHTQLKIISDFWNQAPIGKGYLDYTDTSTWPDPWTMLDIKILDGNSLSLGMFYTILLSHNVPVDKSNIKLAMIRQSTISWEGMVCIINDRWIIGYDVDAVWEIDAIPDLRIMHMYKYDLQKRCIREIPMYTEHAQTV